MVSFAVINVVLLDGTILQYKNATLLEVAKDCLSYPAINSTPLLIIICKTNKLYFNTEAFISWVQKEISIETLLNLVKVDNLARNTIFIETKELEVDCNSLWFVKNNLCILVDADNYLAIGLDDRFTLLD